jgi:hypothetical protein
MTDERVVFAARKPLKILVIAAVAVPISAGVVFLPQGSTSTTDSLSTISNAAIAGIVAVAVALALVVAYAIAWAIIRKMVIEIDGTTIHAVSRQPKGEWTFDASQVVEVVRTRDRRNGGDVNVVVRLKAAADGPGASPRGARLPTAFVGRPHEAERAVLDVIRRCAPDVIIPDRVTWIGQLDWWTALLR